MKNFIQKTIIMFVIAGICYFQLSAQPCSDTLYIRRDDEVFDAYGRKLSSHHLITSSSNHLINISHLPAGVYVVKILTENGVITRKVVKN
jgi:hypothetical protein